MGDQRSLWRESFNLIFHFQQGHEMTQFYIGCKQVEAYPQEKDGEAGYGVNYPDGYKSWCPKAVFESAYFPMGKKKYQHNGNSVVIDECNQNAITQEMVDNFIASYEIRTVGRKTTVVQATLKNGFEIVESSSCVDPANYSEELGASICMDRIKNQIWHLLGFALQWAHTGLKIYG